MKKNLVIVESPTKARTISRFLGSDFIVESSYGHIRDLPQSKLGVDTENNFEPQYIIPRKANAVVKKLKGEAKKADRIILATDEDREGEAIAWHLVQALGLNDQIDKSSRQKSGLDKNDKIATSSSEAVDQAKRLTKRSGSPLVERIVFHEITKKAIDEALKNPRAVDIQRVDAQQARRILDRLVGYKLSPFLWKKVYRGLSAGRVQSVAVRLIVEREREIEKFKPEEYWSLDAIIKKTNGEEFIAALFRIGENPVEKFTLKQKADADAIIQELKDASWSVAEVEKRTVLKNAPVPFTTSTLQQDAFRRLGFSAKQTMYIAQQLYEGVEIGEEGSAGLITYMRTDSLNLSAESLMEAAQFIRKEFGDPYALAAPRYFKTKSKGAQEAHEAIRPTDPARTPESIKEKLDRRQYKLYDLIWRRFMATQMPAAIFDSTSADVSAGRFIFRANGQTLKFDGFLRVYPTKFSETTLPELKKGETVLLKELKPGQHFTEPPARLTEASLVKMLEKFGIGRPSTYAPIISTIQDRGYVEKYERRYLKPTETGFLVNDILVEHFPKVVDAQFTAKMEEELDEVATGEKKWQPVIREFYEPFAKNLEAKYEEVKKHEIAETTDEICEKCGKPMAVKLGRFGKFLACSGFPECKTTKTLKDAPSTIGMKCPKCKEGDVIIRYTKRKRIFFGCSRYPECDYASWTDPRKSDKESDSMSS